MAGDWIKMRDDLDDDQAVIFIASTLKLDIDTVIGKLWRLWCWAGRNTSNGLIALGTAEMIDGVAKCDGFAHAMRAVEWLDISPGAGVRFPRWSSHNSKSSKQRALAATRMANKRAKELRSHRNASVTRAEQSRAEKSRENPAAAGDSAGGLLPALPATGRDALLKCRVGEPALSVLSPLVSPQEVLDAAKTIRPGRKNHVGVLVAELCKAHGVTLPKRRAETVGTIVSGVVGKIGGSDFQAAQARADEARRKAPAL